MPTPPPSQPGSSLLSYCRNRRARRKMPHGNELPPACRPPLLLSEEASAITAHRWFRLHKRWLYGAKRPAEDVVLKAGIQWPKQAKGSKDVDVKTTHSEA